MLSTLILTLNSVLLLFMLVPEAVGQAQAEIYATGLTAPQGLAVDAQGQLWVAQQGTGHDDGLISVITSDGQAHPFLANLPSKIVQGQPESAHHLLIADGMLWATLGVGEESPDGFLVRADLSGFTPGDDALSMNDVAMEDVGSFVLAHSFSNDTDQTNIYNMAAGPNGDLFIVDASANAVIRREASTGILSVFAELPGVPNPTSIGPPVMQAVPTGIVFTNNRLYVSAFPGFPFPDGAARIFEIDLQGTVTVFHEGLTAAVDLALDPEGNLVVAQFGRFSPASGFFPNTGSIVRLTESGTQTLASGLNFPAGICFDARGTLYIAALADGQILRVSAMQTATEPDTDPAQTFTLLSNHPNPFSLGTTITYQLAQPAHIVLTIFNLLGQEVRTLFDGTQTTGIHTADWDGTDASGQLLPTGLYVYRLQTGQHIQSRTMHFVR